MPFPLRGGGEEPLQRSCEDEVCHIVAFEVITPLIPSTTMEDGTFVGENDDGSAISSTRLHELHADLAAHPLMPLVALLDMYFNDAHALNANCSCPGEHALSIVRSYLATCDQRALLQSSPEVTELVTKMVFIRRYYIEQVETLMKVSTPAAATAQAAVDLSNVTSIDSSSVC